MNRYKVSLVVLMVTFLGTTALAQQPAASPSQEQPRIRARQEALEAEMEAVQAQLQALRASQDPNAPAGRGGRGRGVAPGTTDSLNNNPRAVGLSSNPGNIVVSNGAWWTNTALMARIGLTDDQRLRIERTFENHRQRLTSSRELLEREEAQLARLLDAEQLDRGSVTTQINKVVLARGDMEKENALMTLEMREVLTRAQWTQLQMQQPLSGNDVLNTILNRGPGQRRGGPGTGGGAGARGQQPPNP